ncbi:MAG TPA: prephenate dehydratase, partial [Rhodobiaceae bacterium]|nr:prephenate dehydratase [Rhodobiaceae bacterium]
MGKIAFQGEAGANSHIACQDCYPDMDVMAWATFEE